MDLEIKKLFNRYNEISDEKININDIESIYDKFKLITSKLSFDDIEIITLIDTLLEFKTYGLLDLINEESLYLLSRVIGNNEGFYNEDREYFCIRLKHLLIPGKFNKCKYEEDIVNCLAEFDIMINNIVTEFKKDDYLLLQKYNEELCYIAIKYKEIINEYQKIESKNVSFISDDIIIDATFSHLATMLYFQIAEYDYNYDLYSQVAHRIINNYGEYLYQCRIYGIFQDRSNMIFNPENIYNEYVICKDLLDNEFTNFRLVKMK